MIAAYDDCTEASGGTNFARLRQVVGEENEEVIDEIVQLVVADSFF